MKYLLAVLIIATCMCAMAQSYVNTGVKSVKLRSSGEIINNNTVTGYYMFHALEKTTPQFSNYRLTVLDENLREVNSVTLERSRTYAIIEASFNGRSFGLLGFDRAKNFMELIIYDSTLQNSVTLTRVLKGNNLLRSYGAAANGNETEQRFLVPVAGRGFLLYSVNEDRKAHYRVEFIDNAAQSRWLDQANANANIETAYEAFQDQSTVGSLIEKIVGNNNVEYDLLVNDTKTGERVFRVPVVVGKNSVTVSDVRHDTVSNEYVIFGEYYAENAKEVRDRSAGFMSVVYDGTGKMKSSNPLTWVELSKVTPFDERGKFEGVDAEILMHNTIRTSDGQIFVIGEQYKKAADAGGIAMNIAAVALTGRSVASVVQMNIFNLVIFQFNPDYSINKVHVFDKNKSVVKLPQGSLYYSPKVLSNMARGGFDYRFTQITEGGANFIVTYVDYDRDATEGSSFVVGSIVYTPENTFTVDKFNIRRNRSFFWVLKGKPGYIVVSEYDRKEKKIESRLEKINY